MPTREIWRCTGAAEKASTRGDDQHDHQDPCDDRRGGHNIHLRDGRGIERLAEIVDLRHTLVGRAGAFGLEDDVGREGESRVGKRENAIGWEGKRCTM